MFTTKAKYDEAVARAEKAEGTIAAIAALFGEAAQAEGFDLKAAIQSLADGKEDKPAEPNAKLLAMAAKYNVTPSAQTDDAIVEALETRIDEFAKVVPPAVAPKAAEEKLEDNMKQREITPFEADVLAQIEREKKYNTPVLD